MQTDWTKLAIQIGCVKEYSESGSTYFACNALEEILGDEWIRSTVDHIIAFKSGSEVAMNCLALLRSEKGAVYAYEIYKTSDGERANRAVWLIKHITHKIAFDWVEEFLDNKEVAIWGIGLLDQLLWQSEVYAESKKVKQLLKKASVIHDGLLKDNVKYIKKHLRDRSKS